MDQTQFDAALAKYIEGVTKLYLGWAKPTYPDASVGMTRGGRYIRVVTHSFPGDSSVHTFVDTTNGDILKAAGYKAPAKNGVRGSIFDADHGLSKVNWHGAIYLK